MLDAKLKPWMIEVNHTPSFNSDTSVDEKIMRGAIARYKMLLLAPLPPIYGKRIFHVPVGLLDPSVSHRDAFRLLRTFR